MQELQQKLGQTPQAQAEPSTTSFGDEAWDGFTEDPFAGGDPWAAFGPSETGADAVVTDGFASLTLASGSDESDGTTRKGKKKKKSRKSKKSKKKRKTKKKKKHTREEPTMPAVQEVESDSESSAGRRHSNAKLHEESDNDKKKKRKKTKKKKKGKHSTKKKRSTKSRKKSHKRGGKVSDTSIQANKPRLADDWNEQRTWSQTKFGFKKVKVNWEFIIGGSAWHVYLAHSTMSGKRLVEVNSVVLVSEKKFLDDGSRHMLRLGPSHKCAVIIKENGGFFEYLLEVDGLSFTDAKAKWLRGG